MEVVFDKLAVSLQLAGSSVKNDDAAGVEIAVRSVFTDEIRARIADGRVEQPNLRIQSVGRISSAASLELTRIVRPGLGGLARRWNCIEIPQPLARVHIECSDMAASPIIAP